MDKKPHIYTAYYNDASTSKAFAEFKKDTGSHLKLLYCIDMLNEGIHVDDVDGVILLRPTVSPIIYLQQIGRALSAGSKNQPVIFDLVNNFRQSVLHRLPEKRDAGSIFAVSGHSLAKRAL